MRSRRENLCLKFAKKCLKFEKNRGMFPLNTNLGQDTLRNQEKYEVQFASTSRLLKSSIPQMQRALNADEKWYLMLLVLIGPCGAARPRTNSYIVYNTLQIVKRELIVNYITLINLSLSL